MRGKMQVSYDNTPWLIYYSSRHTHVYKCTKWSENIYVLGSYFFLGLEHEKQTTDGKQRKSQLSLYASFLSFKLGWCKGRKIFPILSSDQWVYECVLSYTANLGSCFFFNLWYFFFGRDVFIFLRTPKKSLSKNTKKVP